MTMSARRLGRLDPASTLFLCCDIQEAFRGVIHKFPALLKTAQRMMATARILSIPTCVTEQYPRGLKQTVAELDIADCAKVRAARALSMPPSRVRAANDDHTHSKICTDSA